MSLLIRKRKTTEMRNFLFLTLLLTCTTGCVKKVDILSTEAPEFKNSKQEWVKYFKDVDSVYMYYSFEHIQGIFKNESNAIIHMDIFLDTLNGKIDKNLEYNQSQVQKAIESEIINHDKFNKIKTKYHDHQGKWIKTFDNPKE